MAVLNERVYIDGKECVLIPDEIRDVNPAAECILLDDSISRTHPIWVRESDVAATRGDSPDVIVIGFWQTLIASGLVDLNAPLSIFPTGERSGLFLQSEGGRAIRSGRYAGNRTPHDVPHQPSDGAVVSVDLAGLAVPPIHARLPREIIADERSRQRSKTVVGAVLGFAIAATCGLVAWERTNAAHERQNEFASIQRAIAGAQKTLIRARASHMPLHNQNLSRLQTLVYALDLVANSRSVTIVPTSLSAPSFTATVNGLYAQPGWATEIKPGADGSYRVVYDATQGAG